MSSYEQLSATVARIVDAAIEADLASRGFYGSVDEGFTGNAIRITEADPTDNRTAWIAPPGGARGYSEGATVDEWGEPIEILFDPRAVYGRWRTAIPQRFRAWGDLPDPAGLQPAVDALRDAAVGLTAGGTTLDDQGETTEVDSGNTDLYVFLTYVEQNAPLAGAALSAYQHNYGLRMRPVLSGYQVATCVLGILVAGEQEVWTRARQDVAEIADQVLAAMIAVRDSGGGDFATVLKVFGAAVTAASIFVTGGTGAAVLSGVGKAVGIASAFVKPGQAPPELPFGAGDPEGVLANLEVGLAQLDDTITDEELSLRNAAAGMHQQVVDYDNAYSIAAGVRPLGAPEPAQLTVPDLVPTIAEDTRAVAGVVRSASGTILGTADDGPWTRPGTIGLSRRGHFFEWDLLLEKITTLMDADAVLLDDAAHSLDTFYAQVRGVDGAVSASLRATAGRP